VRLETAWRQKREQKLEQPLRRIASWSASSSEAGAGLRCEYHLVCIEQRQEKKKAVQSSKALSPGRKELVYRYLGQKPTPSLTQLHYRLNSDLFPLRSIVNVTNLELG
jgi:hypothetical protein